MTWLNWSLKLHFGLRTILHLILTHNTQYFCSMNVYFICVIVHVQMWCVYLITCRSNPKRFLSILYVFESVFMLLCFEFLFNCIFHVFHQKLLQRDFCKKLVTKHFLRKWVKAKSRKYKISDKNFRDWIVTVSRVMLTCQKFML